MTRRAIGLSEIEDALVGYLANDALAGGVSAEGTLTDRTSIGSVLPGGSCTDGTSIHGTLLDGVENALQHGQVADAMRYAVLGGGKRIRVLLALAFCEMAGGIAEEALPFGCAVEMIHAYSLIHDDLPCMDDDTLRRGKPTCHVVYGEAVALLAGDALLTRAFEVLATAPLSQAHPSRGLEAVATLARCSGVVGMVGGQALDLCNEAGESPSQEDLLRIYTLKTAELLRASAVLGVLAAPTVLDRYRAGAIRYATHLGIAFQLVDDLLDVTGDPAQTGKARHRDQKLGKTTMVGLLGVEETRRLASFHTAQALDALAVFPSERTEAVRRLSQQLLERNQ